METAQGYLEMAESIYKDYMKEVKLVPCCNVTYPTTVTVYPILTVTGTSASLQCLMPFVRSFPSAVNVIVVFVVFVGREPSH